MRTNNNTDGTGTRRAGVLARIGRWLGSVAAAGLIVDGPAIAKWEWQ